MKITDAVTTAFEIAGLVALAVALVLLAWPVSPALGLGLGGAALLAESWLLSRPTREGSERA